MGGFVQIWEDMGGYGRIRDDKLGHRSICKDMGGYGRIWEVMGGYGWIKDNIEEHGMT